MKYTFTFLFSVLMIFGLQAQKDFTISEDTRSVEVLRPLTYRSGQGLAMDTLIPPIFSEDCANQVFALQPTNEWGFVAGTNEFEDQEKAQKFEFNESASYTVFEVGVFFAGASVVGDGPLRIKVYDVDGATGGPGNLLGTSDDLNVSDILTDEEDLLVTIFDFTTPAPVNDDEFFISIDFSDLYESNDTVGIFQSDVDCGSGEDAWELFNGNWVSMFDSWGGLESDLFVVALVDFQESTSVVDNFNTHQLSIFPSPASDIATLNYSLEDHSDVRIQLFDFSGKLKYSAFKANVPAGLQSEIIDISQMENGYMLARITTQNGSSTKALIIAK